MIEVKSVTKKFDDFTALNKLDITVPKGSVYGLVGPNGSGKTTILKHIAGILVQDSGEVLVNGEKVFENVSVKQKMSFINDDLFFYSTYSIYDTAKYYASIYENWSWERFNNLKEIFKIDTKRRVRRLSKGMQKQVGFWIAISAMPDVILLDEPVDGLDPVMRRNVWKLILQDVAERGTTVLISSHNLRELEDVCDRVGIMYNGHMILEKSLDDVKGRTHKVQVAFKSEFPNELEKKIELLHKEQMGSVHLLIVKGDAEEVTQKISKYNPLICDIIPLNLEEIFIYELGGLGYEFENIIL